MNYSKVLGPTPKMRIIKIIMRIIIMRIIIIIITIINK